MDRSYQREMVPRLRAIDHARTFRIRSRRIARDVRADDLAAAAAQRVVIAARARLARIAPAPKRAERVGRLPVLRELVDLRASGRRCHEAARREPAVGPGADEKIAAGAA